jgi:hypothetical protein
MNQQTSTPGQVLSICCTILSRELDVKTDKRRDTEKRNKNKETHDIPSSDFKRRCCDIEEN